MESTPKSKSLGIAHFFKHISIAIWLNSLEYQFRGRDIMSFSDDCGHDVNATASVFVSLGKILNLN